MVTLCGQNGFGYTKMKRDVAPPTNRIGNLGRIKLSVPDWCCFPKLGEPSRYYHILKTLGIDGVEMVDPSRYKAARAAGLEIINVAGPGKIQGLNHREHHTELLPQIRETIQQAQTQRIPLVIIFSGNRQGASDRDGFENCRRGIEALIPDAEKARVLLGFEMFNVFDHPDYQADHGSFGFELVRAVDSPWLKLLYDIYHMERMGDNI
jgi:hydroxypyruvate isomerase